MPLVVFRKAVFAVMAVSLAAYAVAADKEAASDNKSKVEVREIKVEDITLSVPADWEQKPPSNRLRLAQFVVPAAEGDEQPTEMVVSFFGGGGGGVDANIGRWIGQFASDGRKAKVTKGETEQGAYYFVDVTGTFNMPIGPPIQGRTIELPDARMLGIILEVEGKGNYFLKMAGPQKTVSAQADALRTSIGGDKQTEKPHELK